MKEKIALRNMAKTMEPALRVGKSGISDSFIRELSKVLKKGKLVKIKLLKSSFENKSKDEIISHITKKTSSDLIDSVGNVVVLYKK